MTRKAWKSLFFNPEPAANANIGLKSNTGLMRFQANSTVQKSENDQGSLPRFAALDKTNWGIYTVGKSS
jgi:hypothetical protein